MTAERDPMTLNESSVPALGVEERSDEVAVRRPTAAAARTGPSLALRKVVRRSPQRGTTRPSLRIARTLPTRDRTSAPPDRFPATLEHNEE